MLKKSPPIAAGEPVVRPAGDGAAPSLPAPEVILADYRLVYRSRQVSLLGRREVLTGKAK